MEQTGFSRRHALSLAIASLGLFVSPTAMAQQAPADAVVGPWAADDGSVKLDLFRSGAEYQGRLLYGNKLVEADGVTFKKDVKNPDPALRSRSMKNAVILTGLRYSKGEWTGGSLYDGSSGSTYSCKLWIKDGKMYLRGYLGVSLLGQTRSFHRIAG
ncbi:DUF2147 domain-containing protein [Sphingobium sp. Sx8-8]|uniref:DUF2147 domain-containing protein n=1 Tax=Sphingobium sp. Sx8-8 TaxID=2933617 RepID=UPI001F58C9DE|nr:DUF2147 domain-containing protein [Sphingobium sp. Sx8-8]